MLRLSRAHTNVTHVGRWMRTYTPHISALGLRMHRSSMQHGWRAAAAATAALWKIWVIRKRLQGRVGEVRAVSFTSSKIMRAR